MEALNVEGGRLGSQGIQQWLYKYDEEQYKFDDFQK
jgi:hypothetical protein